MKERIYKWKKKGKKSTENNNYKNTKYNEINISILYRVSQKCGQTENKENYGS